MANIHRRIERQIRAAVKKLKRGEIPFPPPPRQVSAAEEQQFIEEMKRYRRTLQLGIESLSSDSSRAGHKKRLALDQQLVSIEELLKFASAPPSSWPNPDEHDAEGSGVEPAASVSRGLRQDES